MSMSPEFRDYILDMLADLGPVQAKRMFGGGGLYLDGTMFAIVADDELFFKTDEGNRAAYEDAGMDPFTYSRGEKTFAMSYHRLPEDLLEDSDKLIDWARQAWEAARRSGTKKKKPKQRKKA